MSKVWGESGAFEENLFLSVSNGYKLDSSNYLISLALSCLIFVQRLPNSYAIYKI